MIYKGFLFDLDDTLIDRKNAYEYMYRIFYDSHKEINSSMTWEDAKEFFWNLSPNGAADQKKSIEAINKKWPSIPNDPVEHKKFYFETMIQGLNPLPNSYDLIKKMNSLDTKWGIVTNGDHYQFKKIEKVGWEKIIPFLLASDIYGSKKTVNLPLPVSSNRAFLIEILSNIDFSNFQYETEEKTTNGSQFIRKYLEELINKFYPPVSETTS